MSEIRYKEFFNIKNRLESLAEFPDEANLAWLTVTAKQLVEHVNFLDEKISKLEEGERFYERKLSSQQDITKSIAISLGAVCKILAGTAEACEASAKL